VIEADETEIAGKGGDPRLELPDVRRIEQLLVRPLGRVPPDPPEVDPDAAYVPVVLGDPIALSKVVSSLPAAPIAAAISPAVDSETSCRCSTIALAIFSGGPGWRTASRASSQFAGGSMTLREAVAAALTAMIAAIARRPCACTATRSAGGRAFHFRISA
jgi:hypothetical protein